MVSRRLAVTFLLIILWGMSLTVSVGRMESEVYSSGWRLLPAKKSCPANIEFLNYTIITSTCKGPRYPADICCGAFEELACPYAKYLDNLTTDSASTLFSCINLYGKYPPGLFANECKESKRGLECAALEPTTSENGRGSNSNVTCIPSALRKTVALALTIAMAFSIC